MAQGAEKAGNADYPWQVCLEDDSGEGIGAGIMLDDEYILTCAHVVAPGQGPEKPILRVRFDNRGTLSYGQAEIVAECFRPADDETGRGDIALLRLRKPLRGQPRTLLRRAWRVGQLVRVFGYPRNVPHGMWAEAKIAGRSALQSQLVQLNVHPGGPRIEPGFSGTAVIDHDTGDPIGMLSKCEQAPGSACWMIPVNAIVENVPLVTRYLFAASSDPVFSEGRGKTATGAAATALLRALNHWLRSEGPGGICVVAGDLDSARETLLRGVVNPAEADSGTASGPRGIDIAVHAAGKTADQVCRELVVGLGGGAEAGTDVRSLAADLGSPAGVVVDEPDAAGQPEILLDTLAELATSFPRPPVRLLLGFSGRVPERLRGALVAELPAARLGRGHDGRRASGRLAGDADQRLAAAADLLAELAAAEDDACRKHAHVAVRITDVPRPDVTATAALGVRLAILRATQRDPGAEWPTELEACERALRDRRDRVTEATAELGRLLARRDDLRDRLAIFSQLAARYGLEEDERLSRYYQAAYEMLRRAPCSLDRADRAVGDYYAAIMRRQVPR